MIIGVSDVDDTLNSALYTALVSINPIDGNIT